MMPAGTYYIGDLAYVFSDEYWDKVCDITTNDGDCRSGEFEMPDGRRFAMYQTKFGDGSYQDQRRNIYFVDSGTIGCILMSDLDSGKYGEGVGNYSAVITFDKEFSTSYSNGMICFGNVCIDTSRDCECEDDYEF